MSRSFRNSRNRPDHARWRRSRVRDRAILLGVLAVAATIVVFVVLTIFRTPVGPPHDVRGTVEGSGYGYGIRRGLIATVRLSNGEVAMIRVPYILSPGSSVIVKEQALRFGPPAYEYDP